jgi:hypothetical protein
MKPNPTYNPTSSTSESSRGRAERSDKASLRSLVQNLITRLRLWLDKVLSFRYARIVMICVVSFAAGAVWQSYSGAARAAIASWSPYLGWFAPPATSYDRVRADLVAARQSLEKLGNDISRLEAQGANVSRRRADR